jgi:hypothetical protein
MDVQDLIKPEDIENAPEDSRVAFAQIVGNAQRRLSDYTATFKTQDEEAWEAINDARHSFVNVVVSLAKAYKIEPFASIEVPLVHDFGVREYRQFRSDVDHYLTQIMVDNTLRARRSSVYIPDGVKDKIRNYIYGLRTAIDQADVSDSKRASLHKKLDQFEHELQSGRLSLLSAAVLAMTVFALPGGMWASYEVAAKLTTNILQAIGEAKAVEDESQQVRTLESPTALLPPRSADGPSAKRDLDDEVPF